ncbi:SGNH/GDSL hydrolase family protein [Pelagicoccus sp. SDUM812005]|uniref:SGNH/GDSL hydrolase family protein n=1 Tax=Pelagicoccus sp. SDUM812005 TaxID=3041257 RepID=UPI00280CEFF0|nr:SGNH/GDSL hydrolase family protein [Pelagicoccus sp. SDUM812005]MDQ8179569.1 SGNH/GDSL hydrolase family protein [Pelagicoccus sp. SDUM812005]
MKRKLSILIALLVGFYFTNASFAGTAEDAWLSLVGERFAKRPEFYFIENDPALPNVLIYGDSISIGYTERVRSQLKGEANVYRLYRNGSASNAFVPYVSKMLETMENEDLQDRWDFEWDVVHFNVGLHDLKYLKNGKLDKENGQQVSSIDEYKENLHAIVAFLEERFPGAELVFATTTPVPENADGRFAGDAKKYNEAALEVMSEYPAIRINDLYSFAKPHQEEWWVKPGDVHYSELGKNRQGDEVARVIREALSLAQ